jgi:hypothetical protein
MAIILSAYGGKIAEGAVSSVACLTRTLFL